jgi:hypothetical protein
MKKLFTIIFALIALSAYAKYNFAEHSVLKEGNWIKIAVKETGIHKITYQQLKDMGINNPANVHIYGYGGEILEENFAAGLELYKDDLPENAIYFHKGADGIFNNNDYILFYAQGTVKITYNESKEKYSHTINPYSNYGYYFITENSEPIKTISDAVYDLPPIPMTVTETLNYYYVDKEEFNLINSGRMWIGDKFDSKKTQRTYTFNIPNRIKNEYINFNLRAVGVSSLQNTLEVDVDSEQSFNIPLYGTQDFHQGGTEGNINSTFRLNNNSDNIYVNVNFNYNTTKAEAYIDYISINARRELITDGSEPLIISYPGYYYPYVTANYKLTSTNKQLFIWEVTDPQNVLNVTPTITETGYNFSSPYDMERTFIAFDPNIDYPTISSYSSVKNQDLHALENIDVIIISDSKLVNSAEELGKFHKNHDGLSYKVLTTQPIYNEFSSGTPDATAYRMFMKMLYDKAKTADEKPKFLILFGLSGYDNRGIKNEKLDILSFQAKESLNNIYSYITDDYYGFLDDGEGGYIESGKLDVAIGRIPVKTEEEASAYVEKVKRYVLSKDKGEWSNEILFVGDDGDANLHTKQANLLADTIYSRHPEFSPKKLFLDSYKMVQSASGSTYPEAKENIWRYLNDGVLLFNYTGHGSTNSLTGELMITKADIINMKNSNLAVWITATCDFSRYDDYERSAGMELILNPKGGAIASLTTTRSVYSSSNLALVQAAYKYLLPTKEDTETGNILPIGEIMRKAKIALGSDKNKLSFTLLGDPIIKLFYPDNIVITDSINSQSPEEAQIMALGLTTIKAHVEKNNEIRSDFNGTAYVTLYDKKENQQTLGQGGNTPFDFEDYSSIIFSGKVPVVNGEIEVTFMVPKDINYKVGNGRLTYFIINEEGNENGHGYCQNFTIGETDPDAPITADGPVSKVYINTPNFVNGQEVDNTPIFYAHLWDEFGINTIGTGIGHDIILKLNNDPNQTYVLNDYYTAALGDYKSGAVKFNLPKLSDGEYSLFFRAWSLQNISTTNELNFVVKSDTPATVEEFTVYPTPATEYVNFYVKYDRPEDIIDIEFSVIDLAGKTLWRSTEEYMSKDAEYTSKWDFNSSRPAGNGIFIAKVKITTSEGAITHFAKKIIINAQ